MSIKLPVGGTLVQHIAMRQDSNEDLLPVVQLTVGQATVKEERRGRVCNVLGRVGADGEPTTFLVIQFGSGTKGTSKARVAELGGEVTELVAKSRIENICRVEVTD